MDSRVLSAILQGGMGLGGSILQGVGQGKALDAQNEANKARDQVDAMIKMLSIGQNQDQFNQTNSRLGAAQAGSQLGGPLDIQAARQKMALNRAFLFDGPDGGPQYSYPGNPEIRAAMGNLPTFASAKPFFSDQAMMSGELPFWQSIGQQTGGKVGPDFAGSGYAGAGATSSPQGSINAFNQGIQQTQSATDAAGQARLAQTQAAIQQALGGNQAGATGSPAKKKPGFWGKVGRVASQVAPIAAAFIPGVGPIASLAIGGAAGAAGGALDGGGLKGALMGAGTGAASGYLGAKAFGNPSSYVGRDISKVAKVAGKVRF